MLLLQAGLGQKHWVWRRTGRGHLQGSDLIIPVTGSEHCLPSRSSRSSSSGSGYSSVDVAGAGAAGAAGGGTGAGAASVAALSPPAVLLAGSSSLVAITKERTGGRKRNIRSNGYFDQPCMVPSLLLLLLLQVLPFIHSFLPLPLGTFFLYAGLWYTYV